MGNAMSFPYMLMATCGVTDALGPFPLHQLVNTLTTTINNNSMSMHVQDVLPAIQRMSDPDELADYDSTTPTMLDYLANYCVHGIASSYIQAVLVFVDKAFL